MILNVDGSWPHAGTSNGTLSDFIFNRSQVPGATVTDALNALLAVALGPLTIARTVYVNADTGDDSNTGTSPTAPWQTMQRAWNDILTYSKLNATYTMQLQGVGPYTMPNMIGVTCGENGALCILGDSAVEEMLVAGTFDGDVSSYVVPTLAGLGEIDEWGGESIKILTGDLAGARVQLATSTDTSVTVQSINAWNSLGVTAAGDTFEVRRPGTEIVVPVATPGTPQSPGPQAWVGGGTLPYFPRQIISNVKLTGAPLVISNSVVALVGVRVECSLQTVYSQISSGLIGSPDLVGATDAFAWGVQSELVWSSSACSILWFGCKIGGVGFFAGSVGIGDEVVIGGARLDAEVDVVGVAKLEAYGSGYVHSTARIYADTNATFTLLSIDQIFHFEVTSGDCLRSKTGSSMSLDVTTFPFGGAITGGTTDSEGGGLGCNAKGGGRINWVGAPTLTGGVLNEDIDAGNGPVANATLAAPGDGETDLQTLSTVARVTFA